MKCSRCGAEKSRLSKKTGAETLPGGWKRLGAETLCPVCWHKSFVLRAVTFPVAGPLDAEQWPALRKALGEAWADSTRLANWAVLELARAEAPRLAGQEKLGKSPNPYLYPGARKLVPGMSTQAVVAVLNTVSQKYNASRIDVIWRAAAALPWFRYPMPYPLPAATWSARYLSDTEKVPLLKVRLGSENFHLRLRGGPEFRRQLTAFGQLIEGKALPCELALYRAGVSPSANRPALNGHSTPGGGSSVAHRVMAKLVMWLPRAEPKEARAELSLRRADTALWIAEIPPRDPWLLNADHVRRWILEHEERLQRLSEDTKLEGRRPSRDRVRLNEYREKLCRKQNHRLDTFCHTASKLLAEFCARQKVAAVKYNHAATPYLPSFPWFKLEELLKYKLNERGITLDIEEPAAASASAEAPEPARKGARKTRKEKPTNENE